MPLFGTGTAFISTVTRFYQGPKTHGRLMATCILHIPSRRQQIDNQGERHPIFTFKALGCRQGLLQRRSLAGHLPARPLGMRSLRHGRRRHALAVDASLQYGSRLLRLVSINPTSRVIGEAKAAALDQSNDLGISKWRVEVYKQ